MPSSFKKWKSIYEEENLIPFSENKEALLWLKVKSIVRKEIITEFCSLNHIELKKTLLKEQFEELFTILCFNVNDSQKKIDSFIISKNAQLLRKLNQEKLVSELYKLQNFEWGGDYQNSLDKYLVSHYVKALQSYDELISKFDSEIKTAVKGYVLNVGQIKSVDFFINQIPFDLKVRYLPAEFLREQRNRKGYPVELTYLKSQAKKLKIPFDKKAKPSDIHYEISEKLKDRNTDESLEVLRFLKEQNLGIIKECKKDPKLLAKWLYENQGEMRFGSENRLFIVLIDTDDFTASWKLKRNLDILKPAINSYLDGFENKSLDNMKIDFTYQGKSKKYMAYTDVIFVIK